MLHNGGRFASESLADFSGIRSLHGDHIAAWQKSMEAGLEGGSGLVEASGAERVQDKKKIKELEKELHREDRVLAETTALLVLKKKPT